MKRNIIGIGEVVYDIIFKNDKPIEAKAGGSVLNMLVSLSRLGLPVSIIADMVNDKVGKILERFMKENRIKTDFIYWHNEGRSRLALAFLNDQNDAEYLFYKMQNEELPSFNFPKTNSNDLLLFGSYYAIKPSIRHIVEPFLLNCNEKNLIILYDPNFRKSHLYMLNEVIPYILKNISISTVTKGSIEDFEFIFKTKDAEKIWELCKNQGCSNLIITQGAEPVYLFTNSIKKQYTVPCFNSVSTIGAGDAFMAGIAYAMAKMNVNKQNIDNLCQDMWDKIINFAIACSRTVCLSYENYITCEDVKKIELCYK